jgi:hypothetical protein
VTCTFITIGLAFRPERSYGRVRSSTRPLVRRFVNGNQQTRRSTLHKINNCGIVAQLR